MRDELVLSSIFFSISILLFIIVNFTYIFKYYPELLNIISFSKIKINQYVNKLIINNLIGLLILIYYLYTAKYMIYESTSEKIKLFNFVIYISVFLTIFLLLILQIKISN